MKMEDELKCVRVGKSGVTGGLILEVKTLLEKHKKIRVKILKSALKAGERKKIIEDVSGGSNARVLDFRGNTFILEKK